MRIKELYLKNFRCFDELTINFPTDYTVFIGNNGAGKSSILNALQISLYSFVDAAQHDMRNYSIKSNSKIQDNDVLIRSIKSGSTINQQSQYPMIIKSFVEKNNGESISWECTLGKYLVKNIPENRPIIQYLTDLQNQITEDNEIILPIIAYYGTKRQWDKTDDRRVKEISFLPRMNGYTNSLSAKPFNIEVMRHWFSRMLLIARKKPVPEFEAVRNAISSCYKGID